MSKDDPVNPQHYRNAQGVQLIELIRNLPFSIGNSIKYCYRNARKENAKQDLEKALWYLEDFVNHPYLTPSRDGYITEELVNEVLDSADPRDRECCEKLLNVYLSCNDPELFDSWVEASRELLQRRIAEL